MGVFTAISKLVRGEMIGEGTYGRVYFAINMANGEMSVVKQAEIPQTSESKEGRRQVSVVEALKSESEMLKGLDHPHIVKYLNFEETPKFLSMSVLCVSHLDVQLISPCRFLEYMSGGSIGSRLRQFGKFSENVTKSFTAQILEGLEYLHSKGIFHPVIISSSPVFLMLTFYH
jgi:serine/threonine protein kinase